LSTTTFVLNRIKDGINNRGQANKVTTNNPQDNNFNNFTQPPLRELISSQSKIMENLFKKLASNDKILENINNRMDNLFSAIKKHHSFNKMIESQIV
jgi:hypothetical protein